MPRAEKGGWSCFTRAVRTLSMPAISGCRAGQPCQLGCWSGPRRRRKQEPGVRNQESGIRNQESGIRRLEARGRSWVVEARGREARGQGQEAGVEVRLSRLRGRKDR